MTRPGKLLATLLVLLVASIGTGAFAQSANSPLRIVIREGVIRPLPFAIPAFLSESGLASELARNIARVVSQDLVNTRLFREIPAAAHISTIDRVDGPIGFADWRAVNAEALIVGSVEVAGDGNLTTRFRLFDVFAGTALGSGLQFTGSTENWRRVAHKIADAVYSRITGEGGYFDTRIAFVSEAGPKGDRTKRLAIMDYDGANASFLTGDDTIVLAPRFSPDGTRLIYTSYETGIPRVYLMDIETRERRAIVESANMTFAPRFSPDGTKVLLSITEQGNSDVHEVEIATGASRRLTRSGAIDTAASYSPDGKWIVFESDRGRSQQIYLMRAEGGEPRRISFGQGRYGTPVWSPDGEFIAFTKQHAGRFHIGVMRSDGTEERLLSASFLDEGPTWAPNGRVIMFFREMPGSSGGPVLLSVDVTGRNLRRVPTPQYASDPSWSPLLP